MHSLKRPLLSLLLLLTAINAPAETIYRWQDAGDGTHYGDHPPANARHLQPLEVVPGYRWYEVERVYDGDTVLLQGSRKVRFIGINTPEVARRDKPGQEGGERAKQRLESLLAGRRVRLEFDSEREDHYGRLLAHLYDEEGNHLNALLVAEGLAHVNIVPPNIHHLPQLLTLEAQARQQGLGIWKLEHYQVKDLTRGDKLERGFQRLHSRVVNVARKHKYTYLDLEGDIAARIPNRMEDAFTDAGIELSSLQGRSITLRGWTGQRKGRRYLYLDHPLQIEAIE